MATVYRALDLRHDRDVAIKVMNPEFAHGVGRDRFLREIRVTAGLSHPHLLAERHIEASMRLARGADVVNTLGHAARLAAQRGDRAAARRLARRAEQVTQRLADSSVFTKRQAAYLGEAFAAAGDTTRAVRWLAAFSPRGDVHYQLHLHRDPSLAWLHDPRYAFLLVPSELDSTRERAR